MAQTFSKYVNTNNAVVVCGLGASLWFFVSQLQIRKPSSNKREKDAAKEVQAKNGHEKTKKVNINREFFRQLWPIIRIVVPRWKSLETFYIAFVAASLIARSCCDLIMLHSITSIESCIFIKNKELFTSRLLKFLISLPLFSLVNVLLKFGIGELKIRLRKNLANHLYDDYLQKLTHYRVTNLDNRIKNADQVMVSDVEKFCDCLADLYCNISKPLLDIGLFSYQITMNVGALTPGVIAGYFFISGIFLSWLKKPLGYLTIGEQKLEGEFRHVNSRLIAHSEEIAFYHGNVQEKVTVMASFTSLINHLRKVLHFRVFVGVIDNVIAKYLALTLGWVTYSIPFIAGSYGLGDMEVGERSRVYHAYGFMIIRLSQAIGRLVLSGSELTRLAGLTVRVTQMRDVLNDVNNGTYQRTMLQPNLNAQPSSGKLIFKNNQIKFDKVPVVTPNGDVLIKQLFIDIHSGMNVLVCGPNGAGKSSIFRILGELWPLAGGELTKPPSGKLFYIPQKPYMVLGSLRDQITYPHSAAQAKRRNCNDQQLVKYLELVQLGYLLERQDGLDALEDWLDVLSGGEKQRIAMARLFYHSPQFAILDECTSAVSVDVENLMYLYCRQVGITLLTVSHRKSLWKHHEYVLYLDGRGGYTFNPIDEDMEQFGS